MHIRFDGRTAIVTGAAHGFGRAIALGFANLGARVVACDVLKAELDETARLAADRQTRIEARILDVSDRHAVQKAIGATRDAHGRIDILVNDAGGVMGQVGPAARRGVRGGLARDLRREPRRRVLLQPGGRAGDEGGALRPHRQHLERRRPRHQPDRHPGVRVGEGGADRARRASSRTSSGRSASRSTTSRPASCDRTRRPRSNGSRTARTASAGSSRTSRSSASARPTTSPTA